MRSISILFIVLCLVMLIQPAQSTTWDAVSGLSLAEGGYNNPPWSCNVQIGRAGITYASAPFGLWGSDFVGWYAGNWPAFARPVTVT